MGDKGEVDAHRDAIRRNRSRDEKQEGGGASVSDVFADLIRDEGVNALG
ncbi:MAG: hypothetical protein AAGB46_10970 [Verrucomicrobiota bacterium]